jgi:nitrate/TMAO reductase-like tetraheme cytochrome c subunit
MKQEKQFKSLIYKVSSLFLLSMSQVALADGNMATVKIPEKVKSECASCHMVYQPGFLPKESWARIMNNLSNHYGVDASLDPQSVKEINQWLVNHSGTGKKIEVPPPKDRITESAWFLKEHREISQKVWSNPKVKSKSNCMACHTAADKGNYDEDYVRIPK